MRASIGGKQVQLPIKVVRCRLVLLEVLPGLHYLVIIELQRFDLQDVRFREASSPSSTSAWQDRAGPGLPANRTGAQ